MKKLIFFCIAFLCVSFATWSQTSPIRVACIGNSITQGNNTFSSDAAGTLDTYTTHLANYLGTGYQVGNFGHKSRTCLLSGDYPYMNDPRFKAALAFLPNIVTIKLGTNDSKSGNWSTSQNGVLFKRDLISLIDSFAALSTHPRIILCEPIPAYNTSTGSTKISETTLRNTIVPIIRQVAAEKNLEVADLHTPLENFVASKSTMYISDMVHPTEEGSKIIAQALVSTIMRTKFKRVACVGDNITQGAFNYPTMLANRLGGMYVVGNFGVSGCTMMKTGDAPYTNTTVYQQSLTFLPDVVTIELGTNDSKTANWATSNNGEQYRTDLIALINTYKSLSSNPRIILCLPAPAFSALSTINNTVLRSNIDPIIQSVAASMNIEVCDLNTPLLNYSSNFPDGVNPNIYSSDFIAKTFYQAITQKTFKENRDSIFIAKSSIYKIINKGTGKSIDAVNTTQASFADTASTATQQFIFEYCGYGQYKLKQKSTGNYLRTYGSTDTKITAVDSWPGDFLVKVIPTGVKDEYYICRDFTRMYGWDGVATTVLSNRTLIAATDNDKWYIKNLVSRDALDADILAAQTLVDQASEGSTVGQYPSAAITTYQNALSSVLNTVTSSAADATAAQTVLANATQAFYAAMVTEKNKLPSGFYLMKRLGQNVYWTNTEINKANPNYYAETPEFQTLVNDSRPQIFSFSLESNGRYKIQNMTSVAAYINETANLRRDVSSFLVAENTFNLLSNGKAYAVETVKNSTSTGFWVINSSDRVEASTNTNLNGANNFIFELIPTTLNAETAVSNSLVLSPKAIGLHQSVLVSNILSPAKISIYDVCGSLIRQKNKVVGNVLFTIPFGVYMVKIETNNEVFVEKVFVR